MILKPIPKSLHTVTVIVKLARSEKATGPWLKLREAVKAMKDAAADVAFIRDALRAVYGYPVAENRDNADSS